MTDETPTTAPAKDTPATVQPGGLEAPPHPALDPNKKTEATHDPTADDPGNGAD
ncbi:MULTISPECIES: hypothetical protein [unclassified Caulobacter]|uniref:hypothetical protein n=1 Tax=unclassified Caulobacter TaxID=2648921 RepID=UPI0013048CB0|nr:MULTISPECIES: hypothetical protein [unclassified Caulobacter]